MVWLFKKCIWLCAEKTNWGRRGSSTELREVMGPDQWAEEQPRGVLYSQNGLDFRSCRLGEDRSEPQGQGDNSTSCLSQ